MLEDAVVNSQLLFIVTHLITADVCERRRQTLDLCDLCDL